MELIGVQLLSSEEASSRLSTFLTDKDQCREFPELGRGEALAAWHSLLAVQSEAAMTFAVKRSALCCCRLLSRDPSHLNDCVTAEQVGLLMQLGGLIHEEQPSEVVEPGLQLEAKKVLSNLIHQSRVLQAYAIESGIVAATLRQIVNHSSVAADNVESKRFDFRLLFLVTALCPEQRIVARNQFAALGVLNSALQKVIPAKDQRLAPLDSEYIVELTKALFNISLAAETEDTAELIAVAATLETLLNTNIAETEQRMAVHGGIINVLTNFEGRPEVTQKMFADNVSNVRKLLDFLIYKIEHISKSYSLKEEVSAVLSVLWSLSRIHPSVRKFLRATILPPLTSKDIQEKPEKGSSPRNRLVSLLTNADQDVATMTAEFLFVICKHNVGRLVKHTGYGNAAGLLARRGLLRGGDASEDFSPDEDSETEDYQKEAHRINPIIGCIEEDRKNPLEGMSEEQKEYEAMRLVNMIDQLSRGGCIQPCRVGEDGRPEPVEHVLQLQQEMEKLGVDREDDSD